MKTLTATLLAAALSAGFAHAADSKTDPAAFRNLNNKAAADYKAAIANCKGMSGNAKTVCMDEAKVARARTESDAVAQFSNTEKLRIQTRSKLADAEYALAKSRCLGMSGSDKDNCLGMAQSVHTSALADAKADRTASTTGTTATTDTSRSAAMDKCAQVAGQQPGTGCLIDNRAAATTTTTGTTSTAGTSGTAGTTATSTAGAIANRTEAAADKAVQKTKEVASTVADKTERATEKTGAVLADSVITTKVKADIFKEPELKSMAIHVETEKGVVMLSGFVDSKADAEKAATIARGVEGVTQVKSAIKVK